MRFPLSPPPGVNSDETSFSAPGFVSDADKVRFWKGRIQPIGGWAKANATALTGTCRASRSWLDTSTVENIAFGTNSALMVMKDGVLYDITPSGLAAGNVDRTELGFGQGPFGIGPFGGGPLAEFYPRTWSLANWGANLLANPRGKGLYQWTNNTSSVATAVSNAPAACTFMRVNSLRQVMVFGCTQTGGSYNPMTIRGCDFEDNTSWTPTTSNNAFQYTLEGGGRIVGAERFGPYMAVWTDTSVFLGQYTANTLAPWRFDLVADNCGLRGPNAFVVVNQTAYWLTTDLQFYSWAVGDIPRPVQCSVSKDFRDNFLVYQADKCCATTINQFEEVWWFYPDSRDGTENSRYVSLNLSDGSWSKGTLARTAAIDAGAQQYPTFVGTDSYIYNHEYEDDADGSALSCSVTIGGMYLDEGEGRFVVNGIWPDIKDQAGDINFYLLTRDWPQATQDSKGPWLLQPGEDKRDFQVDTRICGAKFMWDSTGAFGRIGKPTLDIIPSGQF